MALAPARTKYRKSQKGSRAGNAKRGNTLTMGVCPDFKDKYVPAIAKTIPDLKRVAPFLTKLNSGVFVDLNDAAVELVGAVLARP